MFESGIQNFRLDSPNMYDKLKSLVPRIIDWSLLLVNSSTSIFTKHRTRLVRVLQRGVSFSVYKDSPFSNFSVHSSRRRETHSTDFHWVCWFQYVRFRWVCWHSGCSDHWGGCCTWSASSCVAADDDYAETCTDTAHTRTVWHPDESEYDS
uniref:Uncharacterized protein n=1 Tax=Cacopsylla melanoneura TaxID=428564 RepID=A0A8D8SWW6_9HEMI